MNSSGSLIGRSKETFHQLSNHLVAIQTSININSLKSGFTKKWEKFIVTVSIEFPFYIKTQIELEKNNFFFFYLLLLSFSFNGSQLISF